MYSSQERILLQNKIIWFFQDCTLCEGLIQIGSGATGYTDLYSDIDLMAGIYDSASVSMICSQLHTFLAASGACYIEKRIWSATAWGLSVYFENGLSADLSFMPTPEIPIRSPQAKLLFAKTDRFQEDFTSKIQAFFKSPPRYGLNDSLHYHFIRELRYIEIALQRGQIIFADIALNNARQYLLSVETVSEGKKLHQFKNYNCLNPQFLTRLEETYPTSQNRENIHLAKERLLVLYLDIVRKCGFLHFDETLLKLLGCFDGSD